MSVRPCCRETCSQSLMRLLSGLIKRKRGKPTTIAWVQTNIVKRNKNQHESTWGTKRRKKNRMPSEQRDTNCSKLILNRTHGEFMWVLVGMMYTVYVNVSHVSICCSSCELHVCFLCRPLFGSQVIWLLICACSPNDFDLAWNYFANLFSRCCQAALSKNRAAHVSFPSDPHLCEQWAMR